MHSGPYLAICLFFLPTFSSADSLQAKLDARSAEAANQIDHAIRAEFANGIEAVAKSGILDKAIKVGDTAPGFKLRNATGQSTSLADLLEKGPVVITWYRGGWCPYCNIALSAFQEELPKIREAGGTLVALTPELPDKALTTKEKSKLEFEVLTDLSHQVAKEYGIVFELTPNVRELYKRFFNLTEFNGIAAGDSTLPLAATYVIDTNGKVTWAFVDADYRKRAEPSDVVAALKALKK